MVLHATSMQQSKRWGNTTRQATHRRRHKVAEQQREVGGSVGRLHAAARLEHTLLRHREDVCSEGGSTLGCGLRHGWCRPRLGSTLHPRTIVGAVVERKRARQRQEGGHCRAACQAQRPWPKGACDLRRCNVCEGRGGSHTSQVCSRALSSGHTAQHTAAHAHSWIRALVLVKVVQHAGASVPAAGTTGATVSAAAPCPYRGCEPWAAVGGGPGKVRQQDERVSAAALLNLQGPRTSAKDSNVGSPLRRSVAAACTGVLQNPAGVYDMPTELLCVEGDASRAPWQPQSASCAAAGGGG